MKAIKFTSFLKLAKKIKPKSVYINFKFLIIENENIRFMLKHDFQIDQNSFEPFELDFDFFKNQIEICEPNDKIRITPFVFAKNSENISFDILPVKEPSFADYDYKNIFKIRIDTNSIHRLKEFASKDHPDFSNVFFVKDHFFATDNKILKYEDAIFSTSNDNITSFSIKKEFIDIIPKGFFQFTVAHVLKPFVDVKKSEYELIMFENDNVNVIITSLKPLIRDFKALFPNKEFGNRSFDNYYTLSINKKVFENEIKKLAAENKEFIFIVKKENESFIIVDEGNLIINCRIKKECQIHDHVLKMALNSKNLLIILKNIKEPIIHMELKEGNIACIINKNSLIMPDKCL